MLVYARQCMVAREAFLNRDRAPLRTTLLAQACFFFYALAQIYKMMSRLETNPL